MSMYTLLYTLLIKTVNRLATYLHNLGLQTADIITSRQLTEMPLHTQVSRWQKLLHMHSADGSTFLMKWCHGCHLESLTSNWKSNFVSWCTLNWTTIGQNFSPIRS